MQFHYVSCKSMVSKSLNTTGSNHIYPKEKQLCKVDGVSSNVEEINCDVPQVSCLSLLMAFFYINDLRFCLQSRETYADNTAINYSFQSVGELSAKLSNDLNYLKEWLYGNGLHR